MTNEAREQAARAVEGIDELAVIADWDNSDDIACEVKKACAAAVRALPVDAASGAEGAREEFTKAARRYAEADLAVAAHYRRPDGADVNAYSREATRLLVACGAEKQAMLVAHDALLAAEAARGRG